MMKIMQKQQQQNNSSAPQQQRMPRWQANVVASQQPPTFAPMPVFHPNPVGAPMFHPAGPTQQQQFANNVSMCYPVNNPGQAFSMGNVPHAMNESVLGQNF